MKKRQTIKKAILMLLIIAMLVPTHSIAAGAEENTVAVSPSSKISSELLTELSLIDDTTRVQVSVEFQDIDDEVVMQLLAEQYPSEYEVYVAAKNSPIMGNVIPTINSDISLKDGADLAESNGIDGELLQRAIEHKREIYKELYLKYNHAMLKNYAGDPEVLFMSTYAPFAIVEVSKKTVEDISCDSNVMGISKFITGEVVAEDLNLANQITRADYVRDGYGNKGTGVKIGQIELEVPNTSDSYLDSANIVIRPGDTATSNHATQVARILVGTDDSGANDGLAPNATLYSCACTTISDFYTGIEWLISQGVNVINMSAGVRLDGGYNAFDKWVDHIAAQHDVHFVKSAGNDAGSITSPGMAYNAITVGGLNAMGGTTVSDFILFSNTNYEETGTDRPEKPNLVAPAVDIWGTSDGTSYAAPQVTGTIAQLCGLNATLKIKQSAMGAILAASAAEKVEATGDGGKGDTFLSSVRINAQISDKEGAGILDSRWARGIVANGNFWSHTINADSFPFEKTITINTSSSSMTRIAIFWIKRNTIDHTTNSVTEADFADLDLYVYDPNGNLVGSSITTKSNFEIVQFKPTISGTYTIRIRAIGCEDKQHVGIAVW